MATISPMSGESNPEACVTCPYNSAHRIQLKRMQFHLVKCKKAYPNAKKEVCPYNSIHMVDEQEYQHHLVTCPNKGVVDLFKYYTPNNAHAIESLPPPELPPADENWDTDHCETYDPAKKLADAPIIQGFVGGTKSQRKKCRIEQRQKFRALDESVQLSNGPPMSEVNAKDKSLSEDQPLRHPTTVPKALSTSVQYASLNNTLAPEVVDDAARVSTSASALGTTRPVKAKLPSNDQPLRQPTTLSKALSTSAQFASLNSSFASVAGDAVNLDLQPGHHVALEKGRGKSLSGMRPPDRLAQYKAGVNRTNHDSTIFATSGRGKFVY